MHQTKFFILSLFMGIGVVFYSEATQIQPWLGNYYEFEERSSILYQKYSFLSEGNHLKRYQSDDFFLNVSVSNALPDYALGVEFEIQGAKTRKAPKGEMDQFKLTGRRLWLDDVAGDDVSVITGLSYIQAFTRSLHDVSCFHHGLYNTEIFLSLGKETVDGAEWGSRWWSSFGFGLAEKGSPWIRYDFDWDKRFCDLHTFGVFAHTLWGLGNQPLYQKNFKGYGSVAHQSIDLGLRYCYLIEFYGNLSVDYSFRVYSRNFPVYAHQLTLQLLYTFGL